MCNIEILYHPLLLDPFGLHKRLEGCSSLQGVMPGILREILTRLLAMLRKELQSILDRRVGGGGDCVRPSRSQDVRHQTALNQTQHDPEYAACSTSWPTAVLASMWGMKSSLSPPFFYGESQCKVRRNPKLMGCFQEMQYLG